MDVETAVREFLRDHVAQREASETVTVDDSLLDSGLLDSAGLFELVSFLEVRLGVAITDEELVPENFETINAIDALLSPKIGVADTGGDTSA